MRHYGVTRVHLNGEEVYRSKSWSQKPRFHRLGDGAKLRKGGNCLAVHCTRREAPIYVDVHVDDGNWLKLTLEGSRITATGQRGGVALKPRSGGLTGKVAPRYVRVVKLPDRVVVFVDDQELPGIAGRWPASRVGLFAGRAAARFNGIMCFSRH